MDRFRGNAVIPSIQPWRTSGVEIDTASLPKNVDIGNGTKNQTRPWCSRESRIQCDNTTPCITQYHTFRRQKTAQRRCD
ncbi:fimbria/pilus outer membrane usher protein [Escherichia coli]